ncbi:MAG: response regulator transcription factor [Thiobacillus sp.]|nr:response regulator transcription factor [Thiobacillus sp.]
MRDNIFATNRQAPVSGWLTAFPEARVVSRLETPAVLPAGSALVWLHVDAGEDVAGLVGGLSDWAPLCPVVVLANQPDAAEGLAALTAGAAGYASALAAPEVLRQIFEVVDRGGTWVGQELMQRLLAALAKHGGKGEVPGLEKLTAREREVALAVAAGASNKEISTRLEITERTVKSHLSAIFHILGVRDRLQLSVLINGIRK